MLSGLQAGNGGDDDRELISAQARDDVFLADRATQAVGDGDAVVAGIADTVAICIRQ